MTDVFAIALASLQRDMGQVDRIAQNVANLSTPGYKREVSAARPFTELVEAGTAGPQPPPGSGAGPTPGAMQVKLDDRVGTLRVTQQPLDLALEGEGYFEVMTGAGPAYTRQGAFGLDAAGRLITAQGHAVLGTNGEIRLTTRTPVVDAAGRITEPDAAAGGAPGRDAPVARLRIVRFEKGTELRHLGNGLLVAAGAAQDVAEAEVRLRQGALENSNVSSMQEMVQLIQTMRHFESMQRVVQGYDELLSTSIRKLGDLS